jgi:hypothetical protein
MYTNNEYTNDLFFLQIIKMMSDEHTLEEENYTNKKASAKRPKILSTRVSERSALSPTSKAALRIQKKILSAISAEEERKRKARKRKLLASKSDDEKVV